MGTISAEKMLMENCVQTVLSNHLSGEKFSLISFQVLRASSELLGFLGDHSKLKVIYEVDGENQEAIFFAKLSPKNNQNKIDFISKYGMFNREIIVYSEIMSKFEENCDTHMWHPRCLFTSSDMLIFEDLSLKGFQMLELKETQDEEHCLVGLTSLARFHSATIIYEEQMSLQCGQKYRVEDHFQKKLSGGLFGYNDWGKIASSVAFRFAEESENFGKNTPYFENVRKNWYNVFKRGLKLLDFSKFERNVVNHLDLWNNNIMFQHDNNGKPTQCVIVDYQACQILPPCADIMSYLYLNLSKELRSVTMKKFLNHYYAIMTEELKNKNIQIEDIFPKGKFDECCEKFKLWGLIHSLINFQFIFIEGDDVMDMIQDSDKFEILLSERRGDIIINSLKNNPTFRQRVLSNADELIESYIYV
ncbi:uncharacterized protein LOC143915607 isoform X2 [Arctopsyche grandis]|uniref:uncharacterized protein LOC143915607 isoform X2 n=1 Tax=Arctopsyche grandis TaxID=121162 RepID=UPI00406D95B8